MWVILEAMNNEIQETPVVSKKARIVGIIMMVVIGLFFALDAVSHILVIPQVVTSFLQMGLPVTLAPILGYIVLICLVLYLFRKTSILGAILLTGYLGGAVMANVYTKTPLFSNILFPVYVGIIVWGALYLLEPRLRNLIPFKK
jgi:hypothetical protein